MTIRKYLLAGAFAIAALLSGVPAFAASITLCAPDVSGAATGPRRVVVSSSTASPQPSYQLNALGCGLVAQADVGFFLSQGYVQQGVLNSVIFTTGVATGTTNFVIGNLPAGAYIQKVIWNNITANAAGNVALGSTAAGVDIVAAVACGANCLSDTTIAKSTFSTSAPTPLNLSSSAWGSANLTVTIIYGYF
jgi:hypothetical protein